MERLWIEDPASLFTSETYRKFVPTRQMDVPTSMNAIVRLTIYISILLSVIYGNSTILLAIPLVLVTSVLAVKLFPEVRSLETFANKVSAVLKQYTYPTAENPFMNPLLTDILDNPNRGESAPVTSTEVKKKIEEAFQQTTDLHMDTSDKFDLAQSMRTFHTIQSGLIPNDQDGFLQFLAKGVDEPDYSSAFPSRKAKEKSEGYVDAQGSIKTLPNSIEKPTGVTPSGTK